MSEQEAREKKKCTRKARRKTSRMLGLVRDCIMRYYDTSPIPADFLFVSFSRRKAAVNRVVKNDSKERGPPSSPSQTPRFWSIVCGQATAGSPVQVQANILDKERRILCAQTTSTFRILCSGRLETSTTDFFVFLLTSNRDG